MAPVDGAAIGECRDAAYRKQRDQEDWDHRNRRGACEQCIQVKPYAARDEEDGNEDAVARAVELDVQLRMSAHRVAVEDGQDESGGKRTEDDLEPQSAGQRNEPDE